MLKLAILLEITLKLIESVSSLERSTTTIGFQSDYHIFVDEEPLCKVDSKFLSFTIGTDVFRKDNELNFECEKLRVLFNKLSPCYLRIGEGKSNFINFQPRTSVNIASISGGAKKIAYESTNKTNNQVLAPGEGLKLKSIWSNITSTSNADLDDIHANDEDNESGNESGSSQELKKSNIDMPQKIRAYNTPIFLSNSSVNFMPKIIAEKGKTLGLEVRKLYNLTANTFDLIYEFVKSANSQLVFDVKSLKKKNSELLWDPENARLLLDYVSRKKYNVIWEVGNEPQLFEKNSSIAFVGEDYVAFRQLLSVTGNGKLVAPELTGPFNDRRIEKYLRRFLQVSKDAISVLSWHQYNDLKHQESEDSFTDFRILDKFIGQNRRIRKIANKESFKKPIWVTEIGSGFNEQNSLLNNSNTYGSGFSFLDNLGVAASFCMNVVMRKSFILGKNPLVNFEKDLRPNPDYYLSVLFKSLVGSTVLRAQLHENDRKFRVYAHCAKKSHKLTPGAIVVYILNLNDKEKKFSFLGYELLGIDQYLLTGDSMNADFIRLNDQVLYMTENLLPEFHPVHVEQPVSIPAKSFGFYVIETANFYAC